MIGVSNLQSFIASMTQKLTLSAISDESKNYLDKAGITTASSRVIYTLSLHDALPISNRSLHCVSGAISCALKIHGPNLGVGDGRSEEHTSELQSHSDLVCRLLLEKKSFDKNDWRIQPAEFYRFHDAEVNTFGYF